ncbi:MAG: hypothetical protein LBO79_06720 [Zoogloeaceae bacterium]|jgi:hypothetical protein|nr:hypothetical protein [Zoogloeaceae bacterium]
MTHSLRALFRSMLLTWFLLVFLMAIALKLHMPSEAAGSLMESLFTRPVPPPPTSVLQAEAPKVMPKASPPPPKPLPEAPREADIAAWRLLEHGRDDGKGDLGVPVIREVATNEIELRFPFHGAPGQVSFYRLEAKGALSVDLHGAYRLSHVVERPLAQGFLQRLQVYPHPGYIRISGMGRTRDLLRYMSAQAFVAQEQNQLRVVFTLAPPPGDHAIDNKNENGEARDAPVAPL